MVVWPTQIEISYPAVSANQFAHRCPVCDALAARVGETKFGSFPEKTAMSAERCVRPIS